MYPIFATFGKFKLFAYPLIVGIAWGIGYKIARDIYQYKFKTTKGMNTLFWGVMLSSWITAKLLFLAYDNPYRIEEYINYPYFWLGGGFVFYGGLLGGVLFTLFYSHNIKKSFFPMAETLLPSLAIGHAIGRVGCFLSGCCYGTVCQLPWAIYLHGKFRHPTQLYEAALLIALYIFAFKLIKKNINPKKTINWYLLSYSTGRFFIEFFRGDITSHYYLGGLTTAQIISLIIALGSSAVLIRSSSRH